MIGAIPRWIRARFDLLGRSGPALLINERIRLKSATMHAAMTLAGDGASRSILPQDDFEKRPETRGSDMDL